MQGELFADWRHHAFVTNSTLTTIQADARHRDHAIIEQVIAELKDGPLAHLPSGHYAANAAGGPTTPTRSTTPTTPTTTPGRTRPVDQG